MDQEHDDDRLEQKEEMEILTEILDPCCFSANKCTTLSGHLDAKVTIEGKFLHVKCPKYEAENADDRIWALEHLPPLTLRFFLPSDYPSNSKPNFTLSSNWLSSEALSVLCKKLDDLWDENKGMPILFVWHSYLKDNVLSTFGFRSQDVYELSSHIQAPPEMTHKSSQSDPRAIAETCTDMTLLEYLVGYDQYQRKKQFLQSFHSCWICLTEKRGSDCFILRRCLHVFCVECLKDYFSLHITEGNLESVKCPHLDCQLVPSQKEIETLVGPELFERYDRILLNRSLDLMTDITPCPRISCQQPVLLPDDPNDKLGKCDSCGYAFCKYCKLLYHGVDYCPSRDDETDLLCKKYVSGSGKVRKCLEVMYGKEKFMTAEVWDQMYANYVNGTEKDRQLLEKEYGKKTFTTEGVWKQMIQRHQRYVNGTEKDRERLEEEYGKEKFMTGEVIEQMFQKYYVHGTESERVFMEERYGYGLGTFKEKLRLQQRQRRDENRFSQSWIQTNTKACPGCDTRIEKNGGCDHMNYWRCRADFWWSNPEIEYLYV